MCGGILAAPISTGVEQDGDAWNYPEPWGEPTQAVENQRKSKWKCKFRLPFTLLHWQDVFPLTLQNTASNLDSAIKCTIKRLPRPLQMLSHLITALKNPRGDKWSCCFPPILLSERCFLFDRRLCQLLQQHHPSYLHFQDLGDRNYQKERKKSSKWERWSHGAEWRMRKHLFESFCALRESGANSAIL